MLLIQLLKPKLKVEVRLLKRRLKDVARKHCVPELYTVVKQEKTNINE